MKLARSKAITSGRKLNTIISQVRSHDGERKMKTYSNSVMYITYHEFLINT